jgi:hypothetical protein
MIVNLSSVRLRFRLLVLLPLVRPAGPGKGLPQPQLLVAALSLPPVESHQLRQRGKGAPVRHAVVKPRHVTKLLLLQAVADDVVKDGVASGRIGIEIVPPELFQ